MRRVLRAGGRLAAVVWDEPSRNPFFIRMLEVMTRFLALPAPDPAAPGPFRLAPADSLASVLRGAGFADVVVESLPMTVECASADEYRRLFADVAAGWKPRTAALPAEDRARLEEAVAEAVAPYRVDGRVRMSATALCASGRR
jgi:hypothetical protein